MCSIQTINLLSKKDIFRLLIDGHAKYIGQGRTACCFLLKDGTVLKIYKETRIKRELFELYPMLEQVKLLSNLKNGSYIAPEVVFVYENEVIAYKTEYKNAKTLAKIKPYTMVSTILVNLEKLIEDTCLIGEKKFRLGDLHGKNILFNDFFYMIDLDFGHTIEESIENVNIINIRSVIKLILDTLFDVEDDELLKISDPSIFKLYDKTVYENYKNIYSFFDALQDRLNVSDLQVKDLRLKYNGLISKEYNSYYKSF